MRAATMLFDPVDAFAARRRTAGPNPRPYGTVGYRVVARMVAGTRTPVPVTDLPVTATPSGYQVCFSAELTPGRYVVQAHADGYRTRGAQAQVPPEPLTPVRFELEPGYSYAFPTSGTSGAGRGPTLLRGCLHDTDGTAGVEGVMVEVTGLSDRCPTDAMGRWILLFPDTQPSATVTARFTFPGGPTVDVPGVPLRAGEGNGFVHTALSGRVEAAGRPARDAEVSVTGRPGRTLVPPTGGWVHYLALDEGDGRVDVTARLPDGRTATATDVAVHRLAVSPVPTFRFP